MSDIRARSRDPLGLKIGRRATQEGIIPQRKRVTSPIKKKRLNRLDMGESKKRDSKLHLDNDGRRKSSGPRTHGENPKEKREKRKETTKRRSPETRSDWSPTMEMEGAENPGKEESGEDCEHSFSDLSESDHHVYLEGYISLTLSI